VEASRDLSLVAATRNCSSMEYACHSGQCIDINWVCDGDNDCIDSSDETVCRMIALLHLSSVFINLLVNVLIILMLSYHAIKCKSQNYFVIGGMIA